MHVTIQEDHRMRLTYDRHTSKRLPDKFFLRLVKLSKTQILYTVNLSLRKEINTLITKRKSDHII